MTTDKFNAIKTEILKRAKAAEACTEQYRRAYNADNLASLMEVVKDNFSWCCEVQVITADLIKEYREEFAAYDIRANEDANSGYLLVTDSNEVIARGSAKVTARGSAKVTAYDSARVSAYDSATVTAYGYAYCRSYQRIGCKLHDYALHHVTGDNTVYYASDNLKFVKQ